MFEEVKTWVAHEYQGYPIDIAALFPQITLKFNTEAGSPDTVFPGKITIGVSTQRSQMEYYSWIIHELRHAVNFAWSAKTLKAKRDEGFAVEGSGVAVESLLLEPFFRQLLKNDQAYALYALDYGIRDVRFAATTDATLQKYFRADCTGPTAVDTIEFTKNIAEGYGLTGPKAETVALRSHAGTQYFEYIPNGMRVLDAISYLQSQIDPSGGHRIDPYVLFACGLNNPRRDAFYVSALKACMKH